MQLRGALVDRLTQRWVIATGRPIDVADEERWLAGPVGRPEGIGEEWIAQHAALVGAPVSEDRDGGLLPDMRALDGPGFRVQDLHPAVVEFYEHTAAWRLDLWSRWSRWAEPGGRVVNAVFARRLRQLSLPIDPLDVAYGMDSRVLTATASDGTHIGTAWQRTLRATGETVFGGFYGVEHPPEAARPCVHVVFPLPNGSVTVLLRPDVTTVGGLLLTSSGGIFGADGAYLVVRPEGARHGWARRAPLPERFHVFVDDEGQLRCDHQLAFAGAEILRLHYRLAAPQTYVSTTGTPTVSGVRRSRMS